MKSHTLSRLAPASIRDLTVWRSSLGQCDVSVYFVAAGAHSLKPSSVFHIDVVRNIFLKQEAYIQTIEISTAAIAFLKLEAKYNNKWIF